MPGAGDSNANGDTKDGDAAPTPSGRSRRTAAVQNKAWSSLMPHHKDRDDVMDDATTHANTQTPVTTKAAQKATITPPTRGPGRGQATPKAAAAVSAVVKEEKSNAPTGGISAPTQSAPTGTTNTTTTTAPPTRGPPSGGPPPSGTTGGLLANIEKRTAQPVISPSKRLLVDDEELEAEDADLFPVPPETKAAGGASKRRGRPPRDPAKYEEWLQGGPSTAKKGCSDEESSEDDGHMATAHVEYGATIADPDLKVETDSFTSAVSIKTEEECCDSRALSPVMYRGNIAVLPEEGESMTYESEIVHKVDHSPIHSPIVNHQRQGRAPPTTSGQHPTDSSAYLQRHSVSFENYDAGTISSPFVQDYSPQIHPIPPAFTVPPRNDIPPATQSYRASDQSFSILSGKVEKLQVELNQLRPEVERHSSGLLKHKEYLQRQWECTKNRMNEESDKLKGWTCENIKKVKESYEEDINKCKKAHDEEITRLKKSHDEDIARLKSANAEDAVKHEKELSNVKGRLEELEEKSRRMENAVSSIQEMMENKQKPGIESRNLQAAVVARSYDPVTPAPGKRGRSNRASRKRPGSPPILKDAKRSIFSSPRLDRVPSSTPRERSPSPPSFGSLARSRERRSLSPDCCNTGTCSRRPDGPQSPTTVNPPGKADLFHLPSRFSPRKRSCSPHRKEDEKLSSLTLPRGSRPGIVEAWRKAPFLGFCIFCDEMRRPDKFHRSVDCEIDDDWKWRRMVALKKGRCWACSRIRFQHDIADCATRLCARCKKCSQRKCGGILSCSNYFKDRHLEPDGDYSEDSMNE